MRLTLLAIFSLLFFIATQAQKQNFNYFKGNYKEMFIEAESFLLYGDYQDALHLYRLLSSYIPNNYNLKYRIGLCMLNTPYLKDNAVEAFESASKVVANTTKESSLKETRAPMDALFQLGVAYRINNRLDEAIESYKKFISLADSTLYDKQVAWEEIKTCETAKKMIANPVTVSVENLGMPPNDNMPNINVLISGNDSVMVYVTKQKFYDAVFIARRKTDGKWGKPVNIIPELGIDNKCYPTSISYNGDEIYFYVSIDFGGDIFVSRYFNKRWSLIQKLNKNINTKYWESHAAITSDSKTLYFTSNREGGQGGLDIYKSEKDNEGEWGPAVNIGAAINTRFDEQTPFLTDDGTKLFFSSLGHNSMGGFDIFVSDRNGNNWGQPQNIGYPINTTDDDLFFFPIQDGSQGILSVFKREGLGHHDAYIYRFTLP